MKSKTGWWRNVHGYIMFTVHIVYISMYVYKPQSISDFLLQYVLWFYDHYTHHKFHPPVLSLCCLVGERSVSVPPAVEATREATTATFKEACDESSLDVSLTTLWFWGFWGFLAPHLVGKYIIPGSVHLSIDSRVTCSIYVCWAMATHKTLGWNMTSWLVDWFIPPSR